ncbi:DUF4129 domain-containing protein [Sporosarcina sp. BI001-red]|uniref:DUF4129 domain-containing protein n=1 Tax=Sporosarcina sp. BI001-red TaxID=2282866 RepID=UPI000E25F645|nr:DUF4129 domain-containing protein [Sporosarcina sp. BI001-red]REB10979.1 DUF4129 domain-containing protein [Sporosarcina sp. BI001-red]
MDNVKNVKDELESILSKKEYTVYTDQETNFFTVLWEKIKAWFVEFLERLFPSMKKTSMIAGPILAIVIIVMLILVAIALVYFVRRRKRRQIVHSKIPLQSMKEIDWSFQMHLTEASKQEELNRLTPATRHMFLAILLYFHEKQWLEARIWKTNWEYYEELKKVNQQTASQFYHIARFFDEVTYGEREVQIDEYQEFRMKVMDALGESVE